MSCPKVESLSSGATAQLSTVTGAFQIQVVQYTHDSSQSELSMDFLVDTSFEEPFFQYILFLFCALTDFADSFNENHCNVSHEY